MGFRLILLTFLIIQNLNATTHNYRFTQKEFRDDAFVAREVMPEHLTMMDCAFKCAQSGSGCTACRPNPVGKGYERGIVIYGIRPEAGKPMVTLMSLYKCMRITTKLFICKEIFPEIEIFIMKYFSSRKYFLKNFPC